MGAEEIVGLVEITVTSWVWEGSVVIAAPEGAGAVPWINPGLLVRFLVRR